MGEPDGPEFRLGLTLDLCNVVKTSIRPSGYIDHNNYCRESPIKLFPLHENHYKFTCT